MTDEMLSTFQRITMHVARSGNSFADELPAPGDYRTGCPEGGNHAGGVLDIRQT